MNTYCPACGINVATQFEETPAQRAWLCATCGLVLKKELLGEPPLRAALTKPSRPTPRPAAAMAKPAPRETAAPAPKKAAEIDSIDLDEGSPGEFVLEAGGGERTIGPASGPTAAPAGQLDLGESDPGEFVIEAGGGERTVAPGGAPAASAAPAGQLDLGDSDPGEFVIEAGGGERKIAQSAPAPRTAAPAAPAPARQAAPAAAASAANRLEIFDNVLVADESPQLRETFTVALRRAAIGREVTVCANGEQLLQAVGEQFARRNPVGLIVLEADLPMINGFFAAVALRAFERGLGMPPTPLVFFSTHPCDDAFRQVLEYSQPARYLHKGTDPNPVVIAQRLLAALSTLRR